MRSSLSCFRSILYIPGHERVTDGQYYSYNVILSEKITDQYNFQLN
jgi:hypothetical protein